MRAGVEAAEAEDARRPAQHTVSPPAGLDEAALEKLRAATFDVLDEDSSSMLSREELAVAHRRDPVRAAAPSPTRTSAAPEAPGPAPGRGHRTSASTSPSWTPCADAEIDDEDDGGANFAPSRRVRG